MKWQGVDCPWRLLLSGFRFASRAKNCIALQRRPMAHAHVQKRRANFCCTHVKVARRQYRNLHVCPTNCACATSINPRSPRAKPTFSSALFFSSPSFVLHPIFFVTISTGDWFPTFFFASGFDGRWFWKNRQKRISARLSCSFRGIKPICKK